MAQGEGTEPRAPGRHAARPPERAPEPEPKRHVAPPRTPARDPAAALAAWDQYRTSEAAAPTKKKAKEPVHEEITPRHAKVSRDKGGNLVFEFEPPRGWRILLGIIFVISAFVAVPATLAAMRDTNSTNIGIALSLGAFSLIFWWGMIGGDRTSVRVVSGVVEVKEGDVMRRFDLRDPRQVVHSFGTPDSRHWRIVFEHPPDPSFVVSAKLVDPISFMQVMERYRGNAFRTG